jgi:hypothetical protein
MTRADVFKALWADPKYLSLHARKDRIAIDLRWAQANGRPEAASLAAAFARAAKRITRYEDAALGAAR